MRKNDKFLYKNAEDVYNEVSELINDAIDLMESGLVGLEDYIRRSLAFFIYHILMPATCAIYANLLTGNLPACFAGLRLMLESLVECYPADLRYPDQPNLWRELSNAWVHTKGLVDRIVSQVIEKSTPPAWALVIPMAYQPSDLEAIEELGKRISQFRRLLKTEIEKYRQDLT